MTTAKTNHLTSFGTGFFPQPNKIDFEFIFANNCNDTDDNLKDAPKINNCFADNMTIFLLLIISFMFYFIGMIWAILKDNKDDKAVSRFFQTLLLVHIEFKKYIFTLLTKVGNYLPYF